MSLNWKLVRLDTILYVTNRIVAQFPSHRFRLWFYRRCLGFEIGADSFIFMNAQFDTKGSFKLGKRSTINPRCRLDNRGGLIIGDNVSISNEVCILTADHDPNDANFAGRTRGVTIGDYVFIGTRAMILGGVTVGRGAVVAAGAVVSRDVPPFTVVAGVPARVISQRRQDLDYSASYFRFFQ